MDHYDQIRAALLQKRQTLIERIEAIKKDKFRLNNPLNADSGEQAVEVENDEVIDALDETSRREFMQIENALRRMKEGNYEECALCGTTIPMKRLEALPFTDKCIDCAEESER